MAKQKQATDTATEDQVALRITDNVKHDGVEYVIHAEHTVERAIADVLCKLGVAEEVHPEPAADEAPPAE